MAGECRKRHVCAARGGDAPGDLVRLEAAVHSSNAAMAGMRRTPCRGGNCRDARSPRSCCPTTRPSRRRVPARAWAISSTAGAARTCRPAAGWRPGHHHASRPSAESGAPPTGLRGRRAADLDVDDPLVARDLEHPRHRRPRDAEPLRDLLLRELVAVVELRRGVGLLHKCAGQMFRHVVGLYQPTKRPASEDDPMPLTDTTPPPPRRRRPSAAPCARSRRSDGRFAVIAADHGQPLVDMLDGLGVSSAPEEQRAFKADLVDTIGARPARSWWTPTCRCPTSSTTTWSRATWG